MPRSHLRRDLLSALAAAFLLAQPVSPPAQAVQWVDANREDAVSPILPTRRAPQGAPSAPPPLPPGAERVTPLTLETVTRHKPVSGRPQSVRQTVTRTADRTHVATGPEREWLFERNTLDSRRVIGTLIEHASRALIVYEESDLRRVMGISGWAHTLTLGFDPGLLAGLGRSDETRVIGGIQFTRYVAASKRTDFQEVWWSRKEIFPSRFVTADSRGSIEFSVERVRPGVDAALLRSPASRFPAYDRFDLAGWLEGR
jgi:hypothetical protein